MSKRRRPAAARRLAEQRFWGTNRSTTRHAGDTRAADPPADGVDGHVPANGANGAGAHDANPHAPHAPARLIRPTSDPAAVARSLGPPPLALDAALAERHLTAVYEEAVRAATALAAANGLLAADEMSDSAEGPG